MSSEIAEPSRAGVLSPDVRQRHEERFRFVVEAAPISVLMVDERGEVTLCNDELCNMFGYRPQELVGRSVDILLPERFRARHRSQRAGFAGMPARRLMGHERHLTGCRANGSEFPLEIGLAPIETPEGLFTMCTVVDITARKRAEERLVAANNELMQFAYNASHDLRAPLATILGLVRLALDDLDEGNLDQLRADLAEIEGRADHLGDLVEDTLALAKADLVEEPWSPVSAAQIVNRLEEEFAAACRRDGVVLTTEIRDSRKILTQPLRLMTALRNLVENAIKYRDDGKSEPLVRVVVREGPAGAIVFEVVDNGLGIEAEDHTEVFQMFRRFHSNIAGGSGLGLALVKKQTQHLGGTIEFHSDPGGTTFTVTLPPKELR